MATVTVPTDVLTHAGNIACPAGTYEVVREEEWGVVVQVPVHYATRKPQNVGLAPHHYGHPMPEHECWDHADSGIAQDPVVIRCGLCRALLG